MANKYIRKTAILGITLVIIAGLVLFGMHRHTSAPAVTGTHSDNKAGELKENPAPGFNKSQYSLSEPASQWIVVNKKRPLPSSYVPAELIQIAGIQLSAITKNPLNDLLAQSAQDGVALKAISGYRSYSTQKSVYDAYVAKDGQAAADTYSARPGYSEHQTGLAADLGNSSGSCDLDICFADTAGGKWLAAHAYEYGFIIRYGKDKTAATGYQYEPWHVRYVGKELAKQLNDSGQTMEEFFSLPAAPGY